MKRPLVVLLLLHAAVTWAVLGTGSAWATTPLECQTGGMAAILRSGSPGSVFDLWHGAMGSHFLISLLLVPLQAVGEGGVANQVLAYAGSAGLVWVVWTLLERHLGWEAALLGAAGVAFGPPVLARSAWALGDWHWTQMIFDYGALLVALHPRRRWWLLGVVSGLGLANSLGSAPYIGLAWGVALLGGVDRRAVGGLVLAGGLSLPAWWKLFVHVPFGVERAADRTAGRLSSFQPDPAKVVDLFWPELPASLHFDALWMAAVWAAVAWVGVGLLAVQGVRAWRGRRPPLEVLLVLWLGVFAAAYVVLQVRLMVPPDAFHNARSSTSRLLPPLIGALAICSGAAFGGLVRRHRAWWLVGAVLPVLGLGSQVARVGGGSVGDFRGVCFEPIGFQAGQQVGEGALEACDQFEVGVASCRIGAAWGIGFSAASQAHAAFLTDRRGASVLSMGARRDSAAVCDAVPADLEASCLRGFGWHGGAFNWTGQAWPVEACLQLPDRQRPGCYAGVGFPVGDHLAPTPRRIRAVLGQVDAAHRDDVARGVGYAIGRVWARRSAAARICAELGPDATACGRGVQEAFSEREVGSGTAD